MADMQSIYHQQLQKISKQMIQEHNALMNLAHTLAAIAEQPRNGDWVVEKLEEAGVPIGGEEGYLCFCGHFNTDNDMCNHSPDDEEEWREENEQ